MKFFLVMLLISMTKNPLMMVILILLQTIMIGYMINYIYLTFWISYILILIFLGGMLVIFIYIASLTNNEAFSISMNMPIIFLGFIMMFFNSNDYTMFIYHYYDTNMNKFNQPMLSMMNMYNCSMMYSTLMLAIYLMLTLFIIVKICNFNKAPLKKK